LAPPSPATSTTTRAQYGPAFVYLGDISTFGGEGEDAARATHSSLYLRDRTNSLSGLNDSRVKVNNGNQERGGEGSRNDSEGYRATSLGGLLETTPGAAPLPSRQGRGTIYCVHNSTEDASASTGRSGAQQVDPPTADNLSFFRGHWHGDKREGKGVLSLPHAVLEAPWTNDALSPGSRCFVQTRKMKGVVTAAGSESTPRPAGVVTRQPTSEGAWEEEDQSAEQVLLGGPAKLELANKSYFAGNLSARRAGTQAPEMDESAPSGASFRGRAGLAKKKPDTVSSTAVLGPSAWRLTSQDEVEWWPEADLVNRSSNMSSSTARQSPPSCSGRAAKRAHAPQVSFQTPPPSAFSSPSATSAFRLPGSPRRTGTGTCRVLFHNGDSYIGSVREFQLHGQGKYTFAQPSNSRTYAGQFLDGRMDGEGAYAFSNGDVYVGQFHHGAFAGIGCYVHKDKYLYEGEWQDGRMHGRGKLTFANGDVWQGQFDNDKRLSGKYLRFKV